MSAQVTITQLPQAGAITGTELVPIVQNGQTVQTTTSAISSSPNQTQTFITLNQEPTLANSRALSGGTGIGLVDGGAQSTLQITLNGVSGSLETSSNGIIAKTGGSVTGRTLSTSGAGLVVSNGNGVSGNPTFALDGVVATVANLSGTGMLALTSSGTVVSGRNLVGTANQVDIANGSGESGNPTFSIADNAVMPGVEGLTIPAGTTAERPSPANEGEIRYNTDTFQVEAYLNGTWTTFGAGGGTVTSVSGTANQISVANGSTTPVVSIATNPVIPGAGSITVPAGDTASRPVTPVNGMMRYNSDTGLFEGYLSGAWSAFTSGGSGVTSISTGTGLTGGPITSTGTIDIANTAVTAGSYGGATKTLTATVNAQGQLTAMAETAIAITNTQVSGLGTMSTQNASAVAITGGTINATSVGATTPSTGAFSSVAMTSGTITTAPTSGTDIVNKTYADAIASGINFHQSCRLATTTALAANTYNNGTSGVGATLTANANGALSVDSVAVALNNRILVKNEATQANNGVYTVTQTGSAGAPYILTRATDFDSAGTGVDQIDAGDFFLITAGSTLANTSWVQQTPLPITVGTTAIVFQQFGAPLTYSAGTGLNESPAYTFNIANTAVTSGSYGGAATVPTFSVNAQGQLTLATDVSIAIAGSQITSGTVAITNGGTGQSTASAAFNALSPVTSTGDLILGNGVNSATRLAIGANGYILSSNGTTASWQPAPAGGVTTFSAGTTGLTPSTGTTGAITLAGTLALANGGSGQTTAQAAMNAFAGAVTSGSYLRGNGTNVVMNTIQVADVPTLNQNTTGTAANVTGIVAAVNGGTGQSSYAVGDLVYASTTTALSKLADVATGNALISGGVGVAPSYGKIGLTTHVSGTLPIANGGTNSTATATAGGAAYGTGTAYAFTAAGTAGQVLTSAGTSAPVWSGISGGTF